MTAPSVRPGEPRVAEMRAKIGRVVSEIQHAEDCDHDMPMGFCDCWRKPVVDLFAELYEGLAAPRSAGEPPSYSSADSSLTVQQVIDWCTEEALRAGDGTMAARCFPTILAALAPRSEGGDAPAAITTAMRLFTMYRKGDLSATHNEQQANAPDEPQYEGVVFTDGTVAIRWLTALRSTSVWADLETAMGVHGHPEERYGSAIVWFERGDATEARQLEADRIAYNLEELSVDAKPKSLAATLRTLAEQVRDIPASPK